MSGAMTMGALRRRMEAARKNRRGITLIEVLVVLAIIGLVATIVAVNVLPERDRAAVRKAKIDIGVLEQALDSYRLDMQTYPTTEQGLAALTAPPPGVPNADQYRAGGYIKKGGVVDPWGRPYIYKFPGERGGAYDLYSLGPAGVEGGTGDKAAIGNWTDDKP
ncbi:MAG: type II secretion system major pseudopilin GspG [Parvularculaceae bacterium]|nr:type II secretion system major pseudopilin GspG [Parvularculaceae bacterium]